MVVIGQGEVMTLKPHSMFQSSSDLQQVLLGLFLGPRIWTFLWVYGSVWWYTSGLHCLTEPTYSSPALLQKDFCI